MRAARDRPRRCLPLLAGRVYDTHCGSGFDYESVALELLAEGQSDGTFDLRTPRAVRHLLLQCPRGQRQVDRARTIICARLWGAPDWSVARQGHFEPRPRSSCPELAVGALPPGLLDTLRSSEWDALKLRLPYRLTDLDPKLLDEASGLPPPAK